MAARPLGAHRRIHEDEGVSQVLEGSVVLNCGVCCLSELHLVGFPGVRLAKDRPGSLSHEIVFGRLSAIGIDRMLQRHRDFPLGQGQDLSLC